MCNKKIALAVKTKFILSLSAAMFLVGCGSSSEFTNNNLENNGESTILSSSSTETSSSTTQNIVAHNQGKSCLSCHGSSSYRANVLSRDNDGEDDEDGEDDSDEQFTSGGTVYTKIDAANSESVASGYRLRLVLENTGTNVNYYSGRGTGNSNTSYPVGTINSYTAQVIDSNSKVVNSSIANSHDVTRLDCNSCHTASGNSGAPGRITSYNYYSTPAVTAVVESNTTTATTTTPVTTTPTAISFATAVMPVLETKCKACHGSSGNFSVTTAASTHTNLTTNSFVSSASVDSSLLLTKGSGSVMHLGGSVISTTSAEYQTLRDWITQGALNN